MPARNDPRIGDLGELGLSPIESKTYLALLSAPQLTAQAVADAVGVTRTSAYAALRSLADIGLVESGTGYGSKYRAVAPERGLPDLIERQREALQEQLSTRESIAKRLAVELGDLSDGEEDAGELIEILRDPRALRARYDRLQLEADESIDTMVKAPIAATRRGNPAGMKALKRGVRVRSLYEPAVLDDDDVRPFLSEWIAAGEECRLFPGELPIKLGLVDGTTALVPLKTPNSSHPVTGVIIRHPELGSALRILFDRLWEQGKPLEP